LVFGSFQAFEQMFGPTTGESLFFPRSDFCYF
jgi:hypothetical protein